MLLVALLKVLAEWFLPQELVVPSAAKKTSYQMMPSTIVLKRSRHTFESAKSHCVAPQDVEAMPGNSQHKLSHLN
jgi:hypothetical protein